jgi:hypothetical protein
VAWSQNIHCILLLNNYWFHRISMLITEISIYGGCLYTYGLDSDTVKQATDQNKRRCMVKLLNNYWKGCGSKWSWSNFRYHPSIWLEGLRKTTNSLSQESQCPIKIRTIHLSNTSLQCYGLSRLVCRVCTSHEIFLGF